MLLFYRYSRRTLAFLAVILAVEYAIVHRISLDALTRSDVGLSQWRQLLTNCNCTDCEVRHLTLIHDGLYQRAYSAHLLHRVLAISSEDGDPYDAFGDEAFDDDDDDDDEEDSDESLEDDDTDDGAELALVPSISEGVSVPYAYAPGDMLSTPTPVQAALPAAGSRSSLPMGGDPAGVPALHTLTPATEQTPPPHPHELETPQQQIQQTQQRQQQPSLASLPAGSAATAAAPSAAAGSWAPDGAASGSPPLLQAVVWKPIKVLSVYPWQLRAHFFLSLASTRMYLLMGLWPRAAAVAAAAPRRLRQAAHAHIHAQAQAQAQAQAYYYFQQQQQQQATAGHGHGQDQAAGSARVSSGAPSQPGFGSGPSHVHDQAAAAAAAAYGYMGGGGGASGGFAFSHPHAQAQATAHAYAQYAHGYDSSMTGGLYGIDRTSSDESQSLAAALSALGRGVPVFLPPELLVEHGVQEDLMASCVFKPAVKHAAGGGGAASGTGFDSGFGGAGFRSLPRWRTWSSLLGRWVALLAGRIKHHGGRAAARLRAAGVPVGSRFLRHQLRPADGSDGGSSNTSNDPRVSEQHQQQGAAGSQQPPQQHSYAYVECRLYRTDRARNVSYTCPAVLTVLPSPPRGAGRSALYHPYLYQQQPTTQHGAPAHGAGAGVGGSPLPPPQHFPHTHTQQQGPRPRPKPRLVRLLLRLWSDLRYMSYGVVMPYKWAPILAGLLSPHMFLLACLPTVQSLGLLGPYTARLCAYHVVCIALTGADHLLLLRLAAELWMRIRPRGGQPAGGPAGRSWRQWLALGKWLLAEGFLESGWVFRTVVMGIITTKQMELWNYLYGTSFRPHPLLSACLVLPASWLAACACCSAAWRLAGGTQPTSVPLLLFQEGFLSGVSAPLYSLVYIFLAVVGLGGGGVGGGAGGVLGLAAASSWLPPWLLDTLTVSPLLTVVVLDVMWNMDTAARATPLLMVIVNALRVHQAQDEAAVGAFGRRGRGLLGGAAAGGRAGGGVGGLDWGPPRVLAFRDGAALKQTASLWILLEPARWWAHHVRDAVAEEQHMQEQGHHGGAVVGPGGGGARARERAALAAARVAVAARQAGMADLPRGVIAGMMAALVMPPGGEPWPPRQAEQAHALDQLLEAAMEAAAAAGPLRRGRGAAAAAGGDGGDGLHGGGAEEEDLLGLGIVDVDGVDDVLLAAGGGAVDPAGAEADGGEGERMVRTSDGSLRPLSVLEAELRAGLAQVAALRSQLAAVGRGVADLLLLGRWPPPLELPAEALGWCESVPHGFLCPITHSLMTQPALLVSPQLSEASPTYELSAIRQWLRSNRSDPTTGRYLHTYHFIHNDNLRKAIEDWVQDRLAREQQEHQYQHPQRPHSQLQQQQQLRQRQRPLSPAATRPLRGGGAAAAPQRTGAGIGAAPAAARGRVLQPSGAAGAAVAASGAAGAPGAGRYNPVAGPGAGQRSVCVGTSEMGLRMQSPERGRQPGRGGATLAAGSGSRGRSRSRGRTLRPAAADGGGAGGSGGAGSATAAVLARQAVQRATSRQRGLQRAQPQ
ncbi:hypothetical protein PLESTB_000129100 [Pleodorina starrii]|uniref:U-box domain-containing protein n=1 Tax=Pleodorina starrii TaxID=330485 RepID=A0A9W6EXI2_9CHLO|nr:hypothetical protein PLESTM_000488200 [Pleodorina starrii]GLC48717.1 hypothetical protein PLESTB_000129100 [Pleodorina starrii]GLC74268.1 hypothetical protein PLESTF_001483000 [Pleodorina starrii]